MYFGKGINDSLTDPPIFHAERSYIATDTALTGNGVITNYDVIRHDTHNSFNSGIYTIPISGLYYFMFFFTSNSLSVGDIYIRQDGNTIARNMVTRFQNFWQSGSTHCTAYCYVGQDIDAYLNYTTIRNNGCRYSFMGYMKRGGNL